MSPFEACRCVSRASDRPERGSRRGVRARNRSR
ncbi:hypothetical protein EVAR_96792_1, partial [Eumeta japonica]